MNSQVIKRTGLKRLLFTIIHTCNGLKWMAKNEAAFQQELLLFWPLTIVALLLDTTPTNKAIMIVAMLFVLLVELLNTAIEVVVDRIGTEFNSLSGLAKDIASAAVFMSMLMASIIWAAVLWSL